jgi:hypothetical protein
MDNGQKDNVDCVELKKVDRRSTSHCADDSAVVVPLETYNTTHCCLITELKIL